MLAESHRRQIAPGGDSVRSRGGIGAGRPCGQGPSVGPARRTELQAGVLGGGAGPLGRERLPTTEPSSAAPAHLH